MDSPFEPLALAAFQAAAQRVLAYRTLLAEAEVDAAHVVDSRTFRSLPVLDKACTFQRFSIEKLCLDGEIGELSSVLTSSGYSGIFAFGLNAAADQGVVSGWIDNLLDYLFHIKSRKTLLVNCLPMGVKVPTRACTLAETSVRPDMVVGLVKAFSSHYEQIILVGEAAFIKLVLELGFRGGIDWSALRVQVILGEEPLAENARIYLERLLGSDVTRPEKGIIASSMGVAEVGLNIFSEIPPAAPLILLRRRLHENPEACQTLFGARLTVPCLFTYDPRRVLVEFDDAGRLVLTTLEPHLRIPLIRYTTGDRGAWLVLPADMREQIEAWGISWELLNSIPIVVIHGRGDHALAGDAPVYPEAVKEGIYYNPVLAALITANFRLVSGPSSVLVRIQLSPGVNPTAEIEEGLRTAIARYVEAPIQVICEPYESFGSGMTLDYERKFAYLSA